MNNPSFRTEPSHRYTPVLFVTLGVMILYTFLLLFIAHTMFLPKSTSYSLELAQNRIPFLIKEQDPLHETRKVLSLGVWDLDGNNLTRDNSSIGYIEGDCIVRWQGHRRIFVTSKNKGGNLYIQTTNPFFEIIEFQANFPDEAKILDDPSSDLYYLLDRSDFSDEYFIEMWIRYKKTSVVPISFEEKNSSISHFIPLSLTWKEQAPYLIGEGVVEGVRILFTGGLQNNRFLMKKQAESILDWSLEERDSSRQLYYDNNLFLTQKHPVGVQSYSIDSHKRNNFETVNNYIDMFYNYLFGTAERESSLIRRGIHLQKPQSVYPLLGYYENTMITTWNPSVQRRIEEQIEPFSVIQMQALRGNRLVSRIDQVGSNINVYSAFSTNEFISEKSNINLEQWLLPNQQGGF